MATYTAGRLNIETMDQIEDNSRFFMQQYIYIDPPTIIRNARYVSAFDPYTKSSDLSIDAGGATCANFSRFSGELSAKLCLYDPSQIIQNKNGDLTYNGKVFLLPVDKRMLADDVDLGDQLALVRTFILTKCMSSVPNIWNANFLGRKIEFYFPRNELPLGIIQAILIKTFGGTGTFCESIGPICYEEIPLNYADQNPVERIDSLIKGDDMKIYKLPWYSPNSNEIANNGRPPDWSRTVVENNMQANEVLYCRLSKPGNYLSAYPGAEQPDWKLLGLSAFIDIVTVRIT